MICYFIASLNQIYNPLIPALSDFQLINGTQWLPLFTQINFWKYLLNYYEGYKSSRDRECMAKHEEVMEL